MKQQLLITGGLGFAGKNYYFKNRYKWKNIIIIDKNSYASDLKYFKKIKLKNHKLIIGDICKKNLYDKYITPQTTIIHFAAESHVDKSYNSSLNFTMSNTYGSHVLLEICRKKKPKKIIFISTDEVYGETFKYKDEKSLLEPTNPYSASKAGADLLAQTYIKSFKLPIIIVRSNNIYGNRQHSEKIIPAIIKALTTRNKVLIHGRGQTLRHFLHVDDFCEAINLISKKSKVREIYNIRGEKCYKILDLVKMMSKVKNLNYKKCYKFITDRPFNDKIYKISVSKLKKLGWREKRVFNEEIKNLIINKSFI